MIQHQVVVSAGDDAEVTGVLRSLTIGRPASAGRGRDSRVRIETVLELTGPIEDIERSLERIQQAVTDAVRP